MRRNFLFVMTALIILSCTANAQDNTAQELILDRLGEGVELTEEVSLTEEVEISKDAEFNQVYTSENKTLRKKLNDIYHLEVEHIDRPSYLLDGFLTKEYNNSILETTHLWGAYNADWNLIFQENGNAGNRYEYNAINVGFDGKLKDNIADFRVMIGFRPLSHRNMVQDLFSDVYIATNKIPHHRLQAGHIRPRVGMEGGNSAYTLPFLNRSQIARNYGTVRKLGARAIGNYKLVEYEIGGYSSDTYFNNFFPGGEFIGWINFKPLGLTDGKYGKLTIGSGIDAGQRTDDFCVTGAYISYEYKKFMANFEWANANGSNGGVSGRQNTNHTSGFYTTLGYRITPKLQVLARYDEFDPDKNIKNNNQREYSFGINYFIKGQALRLILNYVFCQNDAAKDSHRIMLGTQILL